jgi:hypothetical protein
VADDEEEPMTGAELADGNLWLHFTKTGQWLDGDAKGAAAGLR